MAAIATSRLKTGPCNQFPGRARLRMDQVGLAVPPGHRAAPGDPADPWPAAPDGRVTGMVTVRDLQHALRRRAPARA